MNVMNIRYIIVAVILMACGLASAGNERASGYHFKTVDRHFDSIAARVLNDEFNRKHTPEAVSNIAKLKKMASAPHNWTPLLTVASWCLRKLNLLYPKNMTMTVP